MEITCNGLSLAYRLFIACGEKGKGKGNGRRAFMFIAADAYEESVICQYRVSSKLRRIRLYSCLPYRRTEVAAQQHASAQSQC